MCLLSRGGEGCVAADGLERATAQLHPDRNAGLMLHRTLDAN
ncbi:MAG: hypothetical protein ACM3UY_04360 [Methanocella sp.]|jgi:hypothetical protein